MTGQRAEPLGVLVVDKPEGPTSHDVVALARRLLRTRQVGHTGTLDPMATGVLVLCLGRATRLSRFLTGQDKTYRGTLRLGLETDTLDRTGRPAGPERPVEASPEQITAAMEELTGSLWQTPPRFSAKRVDGVRAHRLARAGRPGQPRPVQVVVHTFSCLGVDGAEVEFEVRCSAGTYVRSLAAELGRALGCGAHLTALRRTVSGEFHLQDALSLDRMEELAAAGTVWDRLIPPSGLELGLPAVTARDQALDRLAHGGWLEASDLEDTLPGLGEAGLIRILSADGSLLAVGEVEAGGARIQPRVVLLRPQERLVLARPAEA
ncbi:MAG: tRNA pseudouridine(55) synthase TruB [Acidobacteria bacterium]|nr:MAG: tRNA pseudouridine(55) synthase TruB [Acidobacteriota bacterium]